MKRQAKSSEQKKTAVKKQAGKVQTTSKESGKLIGIATPEKGEKLATASTEWPVEMIALDLIDFSPFNHRLVVYETELTEMAKGMKLHGVLESITVRPKEGGRYELVFGERRVRSARIAELVTISATIRILSDIEVKELQLIENIQRENPHPLEVAKGIAQLVAEHLSPDRIAVRLGKSKAFVQGRIKLLNLIQGVQNMFLRNRFSYAEALTIASLSVESQEDFFQQHCKGWETKPHFFIHGLRNILDRYKCNLSDAPFDTKNKDLVPEAGACTRCPFNSAMLKNLFGDSDCHASCMNRSCFFTKCSAQFNLMVSAAYAEHQPAALLYGYYSEDILEKVIALFPEASALPRYQKNTVKLVEAPEYPAKEEYTDDYGDGEEPEFDESGYNQAISEYHAELAEYEALLSSGKLLKGLYVTGKEATAILFVPGVRPNSGSGYNEPKVTAKQVQEAIKAKTVTVELLEGEIARILDKEMRNKELDAEKIQLEIHKRFEALIHDRENIPEPNGQDIVASRMLLHQSLDYGSRHTIQESLFGKDAGRMEDEAMWAAFGNMTEADFAFLVRTGLAAKSDSQRPTNITGYALRQVAAAAGIDTAEVNRTQEAKAEDRQLKVNARILDLNNRIDALKTQAAAQSSEAKAAVEGDEALDPKEAEVA